MAKALAAVALVAVVLTLGRTLIVIWDSKPDLFELLRILLSWQVIAGGLVVGGARTFRAEIGAMLGRIAANDSRQIPRAA